MAFPRLQLKTMSESDSCMLPLLLLACCYLCLVRRVVCRLSWHVTKQQQMMGKHSDSQRAEDTADILATLSKRPKKPPKVSLIPEGNQHSKHFLCCCYFLLKLCVFAIKTSQLVAVLVISLPFLSFSFAPFHVL